MLQIITDLYRHYIIATNNNPKLLIAVGGSAMALHNLRVQSEDIFSSEDIMAEIAKNIEEQSGVSIDVTSKYNLWGILQIPDI